MTIRIKYKDGRELIVKAKKVIEVIKKYDLATAENMETVISIISLD